jgi:hypothetical protein
MARNTARTIASLTERTIASLAARTIANLTARPTTSLTAPTTATNSLISNMRILPISSKKLTHLIEP